MPIDTEPPSLRSLQLHGLRSLQLHALAPYALLADRLDHCLHGLHGATLHRGRRPLAWRPDPTSRGPRGRAKGTPRPPATGECGGAPPFPHRRTAGRYITSESTWELSEACQLSGAGLGGRASAPAADYYTCPRMPDASAAKSDNKSHRWRSRVTRLIPTVARRSSRQWHEDAGQSTDSERLSTCSKRLSDLLEALQTSLKAR